MNITDLKGTITIIDRNIPLAADLLCSLGYEEFDVTECEIVVGDIKEITKKLNDWNIQWKYLN